MNTRTVGRNIGMAILLTIGFPALAGTTYKVWTNGVPSAPYATWETAFTNIQTAIDYASPGDTVLVTDGVYSVSAAIVLSKAVTVKSANGADGTILSLIQPGYTSCVATVSSSNAVLDGFTIRNGYNYNGSSGNGGGVHVSLTGTVQNCVIVSNYALYGGGAYVLTSGNLKNCQIYGNRCGYGGGVFLKAGTVDGCAISNNDCTALNMNYGGGVYLDDAASVLRNCLIRRNRAGRGGGGIYMGNNLVENCTVVENDPGNYQGGGISQSGGTVRNTIVWHNRNYWHQFPNWYKTGGTGVFSCSDDTLAGTSNLTVNPDYSRNGRLKANQY